MDFAGKGYGIGDNMAIKKTIFALEYQFGLCAMKNTICSIYTAK